jgi:hypothetical protein
MSPNPIDWSEKRRDNRLDLPQENLLVVHLMSKDPTGDLAKTLAASVRNLSMRGCGLLFNNKEDWTRLALKQVLVASLDVEGFSIPLQVEVVRLTGGNQAAVRFKPPYPRELEKLEKFLEPRFLGLSLREIDPSKLQMNQQKGFRWFQGVNDTNLFTWVDAQSGIVTQQQLVFLGKVVEWKSTGSVQTGAVRLDDRSVSGDVGWVKAELMDFNPKADPSILQQAKVLIESSKIDLKVRTIFLEKLT